MRKIYFLLLMLYCSLNVFAGKLACPTVAISYSSSTFCISSPTMQTVMMTGTDNFTGGTFSSMPAGLLINTATGDIIPSASTPGTYTVTYTIPPGPGCQAVSVTTNVTISPAPTATITSSQTVCYGNSGVITITGTPNATVTYNIDSGPNQNIVLGTSGTATLMTAPLTSIVVYSLVSISTFDGCTNQISGSATISAQQIPIVTTNVSNSTICSGMNTHIDLTSTVPNTVYSWTVTQNGVNGATAGTGNSINQTLTANSFSEGSVTYTITPSVGGCVGNAISVTIIVTPEPDIIGPSSYILCSEDTINVSFSSSLPGTTYSWTVTAAGVYGASAGTNSTGEIIQTLFTANMNSGQVVYMITPHNNGCSGNPTTFVVQVHPTTIPNIPDGNICIDASTNTAITPYLMDTSLNNDNYDFTWYLNGVIIPDAVNNTCNAMIAGEYSVTAINVINGCETNPEIIYVTETTTASSLSVTESPQENGNYSITATVTGNGTYLYQLDSNEFQESNLFTEVPFGPHTVTVTDTFGCSNLTTSIDLPEIINQGIGEVIIGPNPVTATLTIEKSSTIHKITIQNQIGQTVMENNYNAKNITLNLSELNAGIYFISIDSDKTERRKILKN